MLLLLTYLYLLQRTLAVPIQGSILEDRAEATCTGAGCRSLWNIVWSCVVTIFACTWVAVHPNVPTPEQNAHRRWYSCPLRRASMMLYALIGPEFILTWAWRQRHAASQTSETLKDWSRVHGFFATMGGFVDGNEVLSLERIEELVRNEEIEYPIVSREEIQDRSKGDALTKALVVLQTAWFLLQCVARASQHLAVTELELATAAFAVLNIIVYVLWWDKPLDVQYPISVRRRRDDRAGEEQDRAPEQASPQTMLKVTKNWQNYWDDVADAVFRPFVAMLGNDKHDAFLVIGEPESHGTWMILMAVAVAFGGIHCIGWSFDFPSHTEQLLWRISSIGITGPPLGITALIAFVYLPPVMVYVLDSDSGSDSDLIATLFFIFSMLFSFLYIFSRVLLLAVSLTTLRSLPSSAFQTVEWTTFLPHV